MKMKKYVLDYEATIRGSKIVEAFDEEDAEEQFCSHMSIDEFDEEPIHAELLWVTEQKQDRKKEKK